MEKHFYNLTNPQNSIWLTNQMYPNTAIGNICGTVFIDEKIDFPILEKSINTFVQKNDSFRIKLEHTDGDIKQYVSDFVPFGLEIKKVKTKEDVSKLEKELVSCPFSLIDTLLFKFVAFAFSDGTGGFIMNAHHLIVDAWTVGTTLNGIIEHYEYFTGKRENIPEKYPSYVDFIKSEKDYIEGEKYSKDKAYWENAFKEISEVARIPSSNQIIKDSCVAQRIEFNVPKKTIEKINKYCKENRTSLFTFFMAIYGIYINRVSGLYNFTVGTPILNRTNFSEKNTTGMFVSTIPFGYNINNELNFSEHLSNIAITSLGMLRHQKYPYSHLLTTLRKKDSSIPNLYDIVLSYQNIRSNKQSAKVKYHTKWNFNDCLADSLNIHIYDTDDTGSLNIAYDYMTSVYNENDLRMLHQRILHLIEQVMENPNVKLRELEIVTPDEKEKILHDFNNTTMDYPKDKTIAELFLEQVKKAPNNIAVVFEDKQLTYKELNEKANSLAHYLKNICSGRQNIVGIYMEKSLNYIISILAVLKAGNIFLPISTLHPKNRVEYILKNSNAKVLISSGNLLNNIDFSNICINIDDLSLDENIKNVEIKSVSTDLAYILYTSGSTGNPKGVSIQNYSLINHVFAINKKFEYNILPADNCLSIANISFDASIQEIFIPIILGASLHILPDDSIYNIKPLAEYIANNKITLAFIPPNILDNVYSYLKNFKDIKLNKLLVGVEKIPFATLNKYLSLNENMTIHNGYGPTEATICCISYIYNGKNKSTSDGYVPIGSPLANNKILILDPITKKLQPIFVEGEIIVLGDQVSSGYTDNSLNSAFYTCEYYGEKAYLTGDFGYYTNDGCITFTGRKDTQIKLNGHRIELNGIESIISQYPSIEQVIVIKQTINKKDCISAYYVSRETINVNDLRKFLSEYLPKYMIPSYFVKLDAIPYTNNGKIDRKKLPEPEIIKENKEIILPRNEIDAKLVSLYREVLNIDTISIDDSFFDLGGDSLACINLCAQIQSKFNTQVYVKDIIENPDIKSLSDFITKNITSTENIVITPIPKADYYTVSSAQKRMFLTSNIAGNNSILYNTPGVILLDGEIDFENIEKCINSLISRHESLRTSFEICEENVVQKISDKVTFKLDVLENQNIDNLHSLFVNFVKPFDLTKAPLFRARLVCFDNNKYALFIDMHHIICDGTSAAILIDELCKLYNDEKLPELKITYKDYSAFENKRLSSGALTDAEEFWLQMFEGNIPILNLPTIAPRPAVQSFEGKKVYASISAKMISKINDVAHALGITPYMLMLGAYYVLLSKYTSQEDIVVGSPVIGRDVAEVYNLIGMFVNTLALRERVSSSLSFKEFLLNLKNTLLNCYKYQTYPYDELVNKLNLQRDTSRNPLFDTMFIYQNNGLKNMHFKDIKSEYYIPDTNISKFDLSLEITPNSDGAKLSFEYATKLFSDEFIKNMSCHYINILENVLKNINIKISEIEMLSKQEITKILDALDNTNVNYPKEKTVTSLFEEQVKQSPNNIAVVYNNQKITYKELNEKANSLARFLIKSGIHQGDVVALRMDKKIEMIVSILAIIKAGAAYLPINLVYPNDRACFMITDSSAKVLLCDKVTSTQIETDIPKIFVDFDNTSIYSEKCTNLDLNITPEDLLYIIYTSGSTGISKGAMISHKNVVRLMKNDNFLFNFDEKDVWTMFHAVSFDFSVWEMYGALLYGGKLVLVPDMVAKDANMYLKLLRDEGVTVLNQTPTYFYNLLKCEIAIPNNNLKIRYIVFGGEALNPSLIIKWKEKYPDCKLINMYGITETTVHVTFKELSNTDLTQNNSIIGKPIPTLKILLLDKNLKLVPPLVPGEICVVGDGVFKGYLNRPDLNSTKLIRNPYCLQEVLYRSGDSAIINSSSELEYIGRIDSQVKIRGFRVELGEIEKKLSEVPSIGSCVVVKHTDNNSHDFLCAYYTSSTNIDVKVIREYLKKSMPDYMIPAYFFRLDALPYTPNGKVDKKKLPNPDSSYAKDNYIAPKTELQKNLASAFEKVLNIKPVGINDNFFELGGDSLLAMNLNIELQKISTNIAYADIFHFATVAELEERIHAKSTNELLLKKVENLSGSYLDVLNNNTKKDKRKRNNVKNVLITGCTGFLGIHILREFIEHTNGNIYCIIRENHGKSASERLHQKLNFYFGNKYDDLLDKRIFAVAGNITEPGFGLGHQELLKLAETIDTVVNSAARVAHYGNYKDFYKSNVTSVKYIVDFCKTYNKKLYHVSTTSVSGLKLDSSYPSHNKNKVIEFNESSLYIGQLLDNVYSRTKFEAEQCVLEAISQGLDGYILRMGNLMPRYNDCKFQENILDNYFVIRIISFIKLGMIPKNLLKYPLEFAPVDYAAKAIYKLIKFSSNKNRIFILYNHKITSAYKIINILNKLNCPIRILSEDEFSKEVRVILNNDNTKNLLNYIIDDFDENLHLDYNIGIQMNSNFTAKYLRKLHFRWPKITNKYLYNFINLLLKVMKDDNNK